MSFKVLLSTGLIAASVLSLTAQMGPPIPAGKTVYRGEVLTIIQGNSALDAGGDVSVDRFGFKAGMTRGLDGGRSIGGALNFTRVDYTFQDVPAGGGFAPWEEIDHWDLSLQYRYAIDRESSFFVMPNIGLSGESKASTGDRLQYGAVFGYTKQLRPNLVLGVGGGVFTGLEDTSGFPVIFVYWQINDSWRLGNPFRPGPTGPAGLEIVYTGIPNWEFGFGGGYRSDRFALDEVGPAPGGFGENTGAPLFWRTSREFNSGGSLDLYAGTIIGGELEWENRAGRRIARTDYDPALLFALAFTQRW